jgi:hypothetical protein
VGQTGPLTRHNTPMPRAVRDPVSELFDGGARILLERAYAARGGWAGTRLADPEAAHRNYFRLFHGIDVTGPDNAPTASGRRDDAHTRWGRGFVRAVYYQHRWYSGAPRGGWRRSRRTVPRRAGALELQWGRRLPAVGVIPAGRAVRARIRPGGQPARRAADRLPEARRMYDAEGNPAGRFSQISGRDWQ